VKKHLFLLLLLCNVSYAQVVGTQPTSGVSYTQSGELLNPTVNSWTGTVQGQNGGYSGGTTPAFNPNTNTIIFGYTTASATQTIAINQALAASGTGIKIGGYTYSWSINNDSATDQYGTLSSTVSLKDTSGSTLQSYITNYPQMTGVGFIPYSGTQWFPQDYSLSSVSDLELKFTGKDAKFWAGYYGPQVRNPSLKLEYTVDLCASNPLSDPACPGYAAAYQTQQCSINPLFNPSCPNYTTTQCTINPLFSQACPGYQAANLSLQCSLNPLYDISCPGYESAYAAAQLTQKCNSDPLYSTSCPKYTEEYAKKNILGISTTSTSTTTSQTTNVPTTTVSNDGKVKTEVSKTGDSNVDSVIETKATSASPSDTTSTVKLSPSTGGQSVNTNTNTQGSAQPQQTTKTENKTTPSASERQQPARAERSETKSGTNEGKSNTEMKQASNQKAKEEMKKAEGAKTFDAQIATQASVVNAISFVPGFDSYQTVKIVDVNALQLQRQYGKDVVDNKRLGRGLFGATDLKHQEMTNQQYR
jgi:hypothetical protein